MPLERFTYTFHTATIGGELKCFASFVDGDGNWQESEISLEVYMALDDCRKQESRQQRSVTRHQEQFLFSAEQLDERTLVSPASFEESVSLSLDLWAALPLLTETQRRRFLQYFYHGLSYGQIAVIEGCTKQAVEQSISMAITGIKKFLDDEP